MAVNSCVRQELRMDETFQEKSTTFVAFQLLPEVPPRPPAARRPPPAPAPAPASAWSSLSQQEQLWAACAGYDDIYVWGLRDLARPPGRVHLPDCAQVTCMIRVKRQVRAPGGGAGEPSGPQPVVLTPVSGRCGWAARGCRRGSPGGRSTWWMPRGGRWRRSWWRTRTR